MYIYCTCRIHQSNMENYEEYEKRVKTMINEVEQLEPAKKITQPVQIDKDKLIEQMENIKKEIEKEWKQKTKEIDKCIKTTEEAVTKAKSQEDKDKALKEAQLHKVQLQLIQEQMQQMKQIKDDAEEIKVKLSTCNQEALADLQKEAKKVEQRAQQKEWDEYYMKIACLAALRSKDPKTPVSLVQHIGIIYMYIITGWCLHC